MKKEECVKNAKSVKEMLECVGSRYEWIEDLMSAMAKEVEKGKRGFEIDTAYVAEKLEKMKLWLDEVETALQYRAKLFEVKR